MKPGMASWSTRRVFSAVSRVTIVPFSAWTFSPRSLTGLAVCGDREQARQRRIATTAARRIVAIIGEPNRSSARQALKGFRKCGTYRGLGAKGVRRKHSDDKYRVGSDVVDDRSKRNHGAASGRDTKLCGGDVEGGAGEHIRAHLHLFQRSPAGDDEYARAQRRSIVAANRQLHRHPRRAVRSRGNEAEDGT